MGVMDDYYKFIFNLNIRGGGYRFNKCLTQKETERQFFFWNEINELLHHRSRGATMCKLKILHTVNVHRMAQPN